MPDCPNLNQGCCKRRYCIGTNPRKEVTDWERICVKPEDWGECTVYSGSSSSKP